jgi:hypothetical protein
MSTIFYYYLNKKHSLQYNFFFFFNFFIQIIFTLYHITYFLLSLKKKKKNFLKYKKWLPNGTNFFTILMIISIKSISNELCISHDSRLARIATQNHKKVFHLIIYLKCKIDLS